MENECNKRPFDLFFVGSAGNSIDILLFEGGLCEDVM